MHCSFRKHWFSELYRSSRSIYEQYDKWTHLSSNIETSHLLISPSISLVKTAKLNVVAKIFPNFKFLLESSNFIIGNSYYLPVVTYGCESWTRKKAEHRRIDACEPWCWRRLSRVPWTARRSNQSILKENSPDYSLEGLMLKLKLQYFSYLMCSTDSLEKTLMLGKTEGRRRRGCQRMR